MDEARLEEIFKECKRRKFFLVFAAFPNFTMGEDGRPGVDWDLLTEQFPKEALMPAAEQLKLWCLQERANDVGKDADLSDR